MIEFLSSWVKNISLSLIVVSILEMILPNNKTKKYLKMIMGMFVLFNIISPFIENSDKFNLESLDLSSYDDVKIVSSSIDQTSMDKRLKELYIEELENDITNKIEEKGYIVNKCKVDADILNNQKDSGIKNVIITIDKKNDEKETLEKKLVSEVEKIQKVNIGKSTEKVTNQNITKSDVEIIKKFLIEEYGVNESCLEIN